MPSKHENIEMPTAVTSVSFIRDTQQVVLAMKAEPSEKDVQKYIGLATKFEQKYRPYVYKVLASSKDKSGLGFAWEDVGGRQVPVKDDITGDAIFTEVFRRLFQGGKRGGGYRLLSFDVALGRVGSGAFRTYLRETVRSVYLDMLKGKGTGKNNDREVPCEQIEAFGRCGRSNRGIYRRMVSLRYLAYLHVRQKQNPSGWFYQVATRIFENGESKDDVLNDCLRSHVISGRNVFDVACSRFCEAINNKTKELAKVISQDSAIPEDLALEREWIEAGKKFGRSKVDDIYGRVIRNMVEQYK